LQAIVTGSAAGGGFPQWNCRCRYCAPAWQGDRNLPRRTQASLAVSADGAQWVIVNCSPDIREQIGATPQLQPRKSPRGSPIAAVVLTGGEVDQLGGLLSLRENAPFALYASTSVLEVLKQNPIFDVLGPHFVSRHALTPEETAALPGGLALHPFRVPGKPPLYQERKSSSGKMGNDFTFGLRLSNAEGRTIVYMPTCASLDDELLRMIGAPDVLFFDGTLWTDDEMIEAGVGKKTGRDMGHMPLSGPDGSIAALMNLRCGRKYLVHINNTNPLNCTASQEREFAEAAGWMVTGDGLEISL
jgi:pyrroloquinoline quinone biosynthesis protein B